MVSVLLDNEDFFRQTHTTMTFFRHAVFAIAALCAAYAPAADLKMLPGEVSNF